MLAGPRRKQKIINLRAKNSAWSNDTNKFGQRMLEKMGWSAGKGLGANENGIVEHIVARYKNDEKGLGYEDKNDQWTKHEDDFNSLLANLSNNSENNTENLHSGVSLEDKSKKSKARIHYHKFTRGKDLSRYSEKDLANIFGKKTFKQEKVQEPVKDDNNKVEQKFTEKGNMDDYFKSKLASLKNKPKLLNNDNIDREEVDYGFQGFSTETNSQSDEYDIPKVGFQPFSFYGTQTNNDNKQDTDISEGNEVVKSKKKKSKQKHDNVDTENCSESQEVNSMSEQNSEEQVLPVKKKKSKKDKTKEIDSECIQSSKIKKKKRKNELECINEDQQSDQNNTELLDNNVPKKKKKRKNKDE
ncbi:unnamed protein product [Danaus chrysippus]|uniref:(African queen) hypothetical protein n=1 Tax=Danaus chrysippus TaxID=151541 RepID=A0A8J2QW79_9NEOP|nr:unnamed protein product [Danaus chrysippus]